MNTGDIGSILRLAVKLSPIVRGVHFQPLSYFGRYHVAPEPARRFTLPEVIAAITGQTGDLSDRWNFLPPGTENDHCSFHGSFLVMPDGRLKATSPSADLCCGGTGDGREGLKRAISTVARQWSPASSCCAPGIPAHRDAPARQTPRFRRVSSTRRVPGAGKGLWVLHLLHGLSGRLEHRPRPAAGLLHLHNVTRRPSHSLLRV